MPQRESVPVLAPLVELGQDFSMWVPLLALVLLLALPALTANAPVVAQARSGESEADVALLAASCSGCHAKAASDDAFPQIYGRPAAEIREAMLAFRADERTGTVMNRLAKGYSESEIRALADYLADDLATRDEDAAD